jgi:UDP-N-acetylmuramoylalanine--D-glutamate ligase
VYWFSRTKVVRQGAFVHQGVVMFRPSEQASAEPVLPVSAIPLKGDHNLENVLAAVTVARLAGVSAEVIEGAVRSFRGVKHRLEFVAEIQGVRYYNDSKATNVDAAAKAIAAFAGGIHLILGGKDKDSDYSTLIPLLKARVRAVYTIGAAAEKIEAHLNDAVPAMRAGTLAKALEQASAAAQSGDTVLLAPACSSFDQFLNYEDRGEQFKQAVQALALHAAAPGA